MRMNKFLEAGIIVNTHGIHGEVKIQPWADTPDFISNFKKLYIDNAPVNVLSARIHKSCVIMALDGITDIDGAMSLKNKIICIDRDETQLEKGRYFVADLIGLRAIDSETGGFLGAVADVLTLPSNDVYVIKGDREILVPAVPDFIVETDIEAGYIKLRLIEGM